MPSVSVVITHSTSGNYAPQLNYEQITPILQEVSRSMSMLTDISLKNVILGEEGVQYISYLMEVCLPLKSLTLPLTGLTEAQIYSLQKKAETLRLEEGRVISLEGLPDFLALECIKIDKKDDVQGLNAQPKFEQEENCFVKKFSIFTPSRKKERKISMYGFPANADVHKQEIDWQQEVISKFFKLGKSYKAGAQSSFLYEKILQHIGELEPIKHPIDIDKVCRRSLIIALSKVLSEKEKMPHLFLKMGPTRIEIKPPAKEQDYKRRRQRGNFQMKVGGERYDIAYGKMCMNKYRYLTQAKPDVSNDPLRVETLLKLFSEKIKSFESFSSADLNKSGKIRINQEPPGVVTNIDVKQNVNFLNGLLFLVTVVEVLVRLYRDEKGQVFNYESSEARESDMFPVALAQTRSIRLLLSGQITFQDFLGESQQEAYNSEQHRALYGCVTGKETINHLSIMWSKLFAVNQKYNDWSLELEEWKKFKQDYQATYPESSFIHGKSGMYRDLTNLYGSGSESDSDNPDYSDHEDISGQQIRL